MPPRGNSLRVGPDGCSDGWSDGEAEPVPVPGVASEGGADADPLPDTGADGAPDVAPVDGGEVAGTEDVAPGAELVAPGSGAGPLQPASSPAVTTAAKADRTAGRRSNRLPEICAGLVEPAPYPVRS